MSLKLVSIKHLINKRFYAHFSFFYCEYISDLIASIGIFS